MRRRSTTGWLGPGRTTPDGIGWRGSVRSCALPERSSSRSATERRGIWFRGHFGNLDLFGDLASGLPVSRIRAALQSHETRGALPATPPSSMGRPPGWSRLITRKEPVDPNGCVVRRARDLRPRYRSAGPVTSAEAAPDHWAAEAQPHSGAVQNYNVQGVSPIIQ